MKEKIKNKKTGKKEKFNKNKVLEFLRPRKWKVILTLLLMVYFIFLISVNYQPAKYLMYLPIILSGPLTIFIGDTGIVPLRALFVQFLTYFIEIYLISCLMVLVYEIIKKKFIWIDKDKINKCFFISIFILILLILISLAYISDVRKNAMVEYIPLEDISIEKLRKQTCECPQIEVPVCEPPNTLNSETYVIEECDITCYKPVCIKN